MAEIVGVIASVITLCQTVDYLRKGTKLVAVLRGAPDEYFHLHNEVITTPKPHPPGLTLNLDHCLCLAPG